MAYQKQHDQASEDYCAYVTNMERKTSMCEGPHFPNLGSMFKEKKQQNHKASAGQGKIFTTAGRFGRAEHIDIEYETSEMTCKEEVVEVDTGGYVKNKHHSLGTVRAV